MREEQISQLIEQYIQAPQLDRKSESLQERVVELSTQAATERLELIESEVESLVARESLSYEQALTQTIEKWEELELEAKTRAEEVIRRNTQTRLEEMGEA